MLFHTLEILGNTCLWESKTQLLQQFRPQGFLGLLQQQSILGWHMLSEHQVLSPRLLIMILLHHPVQRKRHTIYLSLCDKEITDILGWRASCPAHGKNMCTPKVLAAGTTWRWRKKKVKKAKKDRQPTNRCVFLLHGSLQNITGRGATAFANEHITRIT